MNGERIYRGEGEITFTCFYPFCQGIYYTLRSANTIAEVSASNDTKANIVTSDSTLSDKLEATTAETSVDNLNTIIEYSDPIVTWEEGNTTTLTVFNEGDLPMPFIIFLESFVEDGDGDENTVENAIIARIGGNYTRDEKYQARQKVYCSGKNRNAV